MIKKLVLPNESVGVFNDPDFVLTTFQILIHILANPWLKPLQTIHPERKTT